jgi:hypothetical protein
MGKYGITHLINGDVTVERPIQETKGERSLSEYELIMKLPSDQRDQALALARLNGNG